jgi:hypothetical protein
MASAVISVGVLHVLLPSAFRVMPGWIFQVVLLGLLAALIIGDPGRIDRDSRWLRLTTTVLFGAITVANAFAVGHLIDGILEEASFTEPGELLRIGAIVWAVNVIAFALWYWDLDSGGAAARARGTGPSRAFVFPETDLPEHADGQWYPHFADYFALSFNTATAFSPTDVSAVKRWAKMLLVAESAISLLIALLVFARAVNIWPAPGS